MSLRDTFFNMLGVETPEVQKTSNSLSRNSRDFLKYGNRDKLYPTWSDVKMSDRDLYRGYSYAVIQKRGNKVASLAKENLKTWAKPEILDEFQKQNRQVIHPYLSLIEDSTEFTEKQFWKNISIYLDLAGRYYLGVLRTEVRPLNPNLPIITTDPTKFIMLNPYEIRRVVDKDGNVAGYIERKKDGRYREWALHQIIEMRELNPFDPDESQWAMTEAAKDAVYTINQSSDYTRHSLDGNVSAPGIITTDVILQDEDFENFRARVTQHTKGEPLFGNGAGAIKWESMQVDLDKAALMDINEINRTTLFAVSGTSKTSLGIEQSGTTRETARVQSEQFVSDTAQPRLEDIIDFLNLDYKKHYSREYKKTGYYIEVQSAVGRDYENETKATAMRQSQLDLALSLIQAGYTQESAYQYAVGDIELADLELEKGLDKPNIGQPGMGGDMGGMMGDNENLGGGDGGGEPFDPDDFGLPDEEEESEEDEEKKDGKQDNSADLNGLNPHEDLEKTDFFAQANTVSEVKADVGTHEHNCTCSNKVNVQDYFAEVGDGATKANEAYEQLSEEILAIEKEAIEISQKSQVKNAFSISDFLNDKQKQSLIKKLKNALQNYWWVIFPMFAENSMNKRNNEFGTNEMFVFNNELQNDVELNADRVAEGHINTIMNDVVDTVNRASTKAMEHEAAKLIVDAYDNNPEKWSEWFSEKPDVEVAMRAILKTDILDVNRRIYERALELAGEHYTGEQISKTIREEFDNISKRRADVIARNETMRAYAWSQYDSDLQFLTNIGKLEQAYKVLYSRRPENEQDKICPFCRTLIEETNENPIPFEQPFLAFGESMQAYDNTGTLQMFTATYEDIQGGVVHPNCACEYRLVFKNASGEFTKTLNGADNDISKNNHLGNGDSSNDGDNNRISEQTEVVNGGKGSGFYGHYGRLGERGGSSHDKTPFSYDKMLATDNIGEAQKIAIDLCYKLIDDIENKHPELIDREQQDRNLRQNYESEYLKWQHMPDRVHNLSYEEYKQKVLAREIGGDGRELVGFHPVHSLALYGAGASPFLEGFLMYVMGANIYHLDREGFDKEHKLSETIDKNPDLWTDYKKPLYRGLSTNDEGIAELKKGAVVSMRGMSSWTSEKEIADHFTKFALYQTGKNPVVFIDKSKKHKGTMFYPFSSSMVYGPQYEYVQSGSNRYKITDVRKDGDIYYADVELD